MMLCIWVCRACLLASFSADFELVRFFFALSEVTLSEVESLRLFLFTAGVFFDLGLILFDLRFRLVPFCVGSVTWLVVGSLAVGIVAVSERFSNSWRIVVRVLSDFSSKKKRSKYWKFNRFWHKTQYKLTTTTKLIIHLYEFDSLKHVTKTSVYQKEYHSYTNENQQMIAFMEWSKNLHFETRNRATFG